MGLLSLAATPRCASAASSRSTTSRSTSPKARSPGLIGPNGAGKTTAFNAITRLYRLDSGDVVFDGHSLLRTPPSRVVRLGIARTFQNVELFPTMTVLENVLVGAHTRLALPARASVARRARSRRSSYVGIASVAGRPAAGLPFGTLKRVELARALVSKPRLLLLDEPAGGLNHEEVEELGDLHPPPPRRAEADACCSSSTT